MLCARMPLREKIFLSGDWSIAFNKRTGDMFLCNNDNESCTLGKAIISTNVFTFAYDGGRYGGSGYIYVNMDLFEPVDTVIKERVVYIIKGNNDAAKEVLYKEVFMNAKDKNFVIYEDPNQLRKFIHDHGEAAQLTGDVFILNEESGLLVEDIIPYLFGHPRIIMLDVSLQNKYSKS